MKNLIFHTLLILGAAARADVPSTHGMLLFGQKADYASHLPMFHAPHDYQLLMKLKLVDLPRSPALKHYGELKAQGPGLFTLVPETMDLTQVIDGQKKSFQATIFEGHFERGGKAIGAVKVEVEQILYAEKLNPFGHQRAESYLAFGADDEYYAAHLIKGQPSFDAIMSIEAPFQIKSGPCPSRLCGSERAIPLSPTMLPVQIHDPDANAPEKLAQPGAMIGQSTGPQAKILKLLYLEEDELAH